MFEYKKEAATERMSKVNETDRRILDHVKRLSKILPERKECLVRELFARLSKLIVLGTRTYVPSAQDYFNQRVFAKWQWSQSFTKLSVSSTSIVVAE